MAGLILRRQARDTQRIVSLAPNVTSILFALGAERQLVAVSKWCKTVAEVGARTQLGDCWKLDIAEVMRLKPQLLIGSVPFASEVVSRILGQPVNFLALNPRCLADIENDIRTLGRLVNRAFRAEGLIHKMRQSFEDIRARADRIRGSSKPRVYCEAWPNPRISSPPWVAELVEIAGGRIVVRAGARVTDDEVAQAMPDVIILAWTAVGGRSKPEQALRNRSWRKVPAVRTKRVFVIRDELLNTPAPPLMKGALELLYAIHPKLKQSRH